MVLYKLEDFDPNYRDTLQGEDIKGLGVYTERNNEKIGTVNDVLVDDDGHFRYLIVDLGFWIFGKKVLLPVGRTRIDHGTDRVYAVGMTREQAENLPEFDERLNLDHDYEERVRGVYRNPSYRTQPLDTSTPLETRTPVEAPLGTTPAHTRDTYRYEQEPSLYGLHEPHHETMKLYEERLIASKRRQKTGDVTVGKHVETETARVAVPVERERVIVERVTPENAGRAVSPGEANFREGEVTRVELHEETPDIRKEAVVREEVRVKKVVEQDTVQAEDTIRREELDVNTSGLPVEER
ncbi:DUF2382 domain-containing protein [Anabaena sp. UHCC 0399]|uniref:DUF2382 domain-containing protein n=1 Tax=Anabaena sp. UHCC 0399 TaxID=3110238 RepID=UPI002B1EA3F9|nr:DUF2382 domain-containing protein [Anabaena sp. UHCC 0399]MEA5566227.1 DUF2382 domain-containing protein [Anabaena sp. UHCC 0399]